MASGAKQQAKLSRAQRSISPSINFSAEAAAGSAALWEQGVGTRVLLGDVKMGNFIDIMEMDLVPIGDVKVPTKSFSQVQVQRCSKRRAAAAVCNVFRSPLSRVSTTRLCGAARASRFQPFRPTPGPSRTGCSSCK